MKKNWFRSGLTAVLCAVMLVTGVSAASIGGGTTTTDVNLRNGASINDGIIVTLQSAIGCVTPPFGCNIFTACGIFHKPFIEVVKGLFPYMAINLLVGLILVLSPDLCMISYNLFH